MSSEKSTLQVEGDIRQGRLFTNRPIRGSLIITPELSQTILKNVSPLLVTALRANEPIQLYIEDLQSPLFPIDFSKADIKKGSLRMGRVIFKNGGPLGSILGILKLGSLRGVNELSVDFTPLYFSMDKGLLQCERFDALLSNTFPIASWGKIDFKRDSVDMSIGLSGVALKQAFRLNNISKSEWVILPMRGSIENASLSRSDATQAIAALIAQDKIKRGGGLIGALISKGKRPVSSRNVPTPSTNPVPWQELFEEDKILQVEEKRGKEDNLDLDKKIKETIFDLF